jgi:two-component system chemotaxis sensor kinase CheA
VNEQRKVVYCNEAASLISEMSIRKITRDRIFTDVLQFEIERDILSGLENIHDPTPYKELNFSSSEGKKGRAQITIQKSPFSQDPQHWIIFFRDVTLEETLQKKYRGELEQKENYIKELQTQNFNLKITQQILKKWFKNEHKKFKI